MITVLLADDHQMVRQGLQALLEHSGDIQIAAAAANGREAVDYAVQICPDVAVLDVSMPIMDGIEAAQNILSFCPHTRVLMLSMHNASGYVVRALQAGASGYLLKEAAGNELLQAVRALHQGQRYFSPSIGKFIQDFLDD